MAPQNLTQLLAIFIYGLHILPNNGVLDAYGHLSMRKPDDPSTIFISRYLEPALVASCDDTVEYYVRDASPVEPDALSGFVERFYATGARLGGAEQLAGLLGGADAEPRLHHVRRRRRGRCGPGRLCAAQCAGLVGGAGHCARV
ncbi:hypothetical protein F4802DRAFT_104189 [Xylaria palmicola]|nr:hypothetical protein F4802DRAFT_104189 [Xylaria palmicola]